MNIQSIHAGKRVLVKRIAITTQPVLEKKIIEVSPSGKYFCTKAGANSAYPNDNYWHNVDEWELIEVLE